MVVIGVWMHKNDKRSVYPDTMLDDSGIDMVIETLDTEMFHHPNLKQDVR